MDVDKIMKKRYNLEGLYIDMAKLSDALNLGYRPLSWRSTPFVSNIEIHEMILIKLSISFFMTN